MFLHALSVRRSGYPLRLSFVHVIEIASGLCARAEHSVARLCSLVMIAFLTVRGWCELKCRVIFFMLFSVESMVNLSVIVNFYLC